MTLHQFPNRIVHEALELSKHGTTFLKEKRVRMSDFPTFNRLCRMMTNFSVHRWPIEQAAPAEGNNTNLSPLQIKICNEGHEMVDACIWLASEKVFPALSRKQTTRIVMTKLAFAFNGQDSNTDDASCFFEELSRFLMSETTRVL